MITECFGSFYPYRKFYITDTSDISNIEYCIYGSSAVNTVNKDYWILQSDDKWHKFGTSETTDASWI